MMLWDLSEKLKVFNLKGKKVERRNDSLRIALFFILLMLPILYISLSHSTRSSGIQKQDYKA